MKGECREPVRLWRRASLLCRGSRPARRRRGCPPDSPKTPLGRVGGTDHAHVTVTTPTLPNVHNASSIAQCSPGRVQRGRIPLCRGSGGVPQNLIDFSRAGGWDRPRPCYGHHADATHRAQRLPKKAEGFIPQNCPLATPMFRRPRRRRPSCPTPPPGDLPTCLPDKQVRRGPQRFGNILLP